MPATSRKLTGAAIIVLGLLLGAAGIYIGEMDDAPGAALLGLLLMTTLLVLGIRRIHRLR